MKKESKSNADKRSLKLKAELILPRILQALVVSNNKCNIRKSEEFGRILAQLKTLIAKTLKIRNILILQDFDQDYQVQFDLSRVDQQPQKEKSPNKARKKWGNNNVFEGLGDPNQKPKQKKQANEDEEDYSDSFEEIPQDFEDEEIEDKDQSEIQDNYEEEDQEDKGKNDIEQFLKTASMNDINVLKQSLSNFGELTKQLVKQAPKKEDDDYIEEDFEEHIDSDEDNDSEEERKAQELLKQQQLKSQQAVQNTARGAKNRPISATYNLANSAKIQTQRNDPIPSVSYQTPVGNQQKNISSNMMSNYPNQLSSQQVIQETPKQPNDQMKKHINTNPFKRPFSQNIPKREPIKATIPISQKKEEKQQSKTSDNAFQKVPIQQILQKIEQLDDQQKEKLMDILNNFDSLTTSLTQSQMYQIESQTNMGQAKPVQQVQKLDLNFLSPVKEKSSNKYLNKKQLVIRVLKTHGSPHLCGITEIEVFDQQGKLIKLTTSQITLRNLGNGPKIPLSRLIDGFKLTNDEKHMWIGYLPVHPKHLEIVIDFDKQTEIGGLKIWNYNKSSIDCTKGIKEAQIFLDDTSVWQGLVASSRGQLNVDYATTILLIEKLIIPKEVLVKETIDEQYDEEESKDDIQLRQSKQSLQPVNNDQQDEVMKKYKSQAVFKNKEDNTQGPIWLSSNASQANMQDMTRFQQQKSQQSQRFNNQDFNTADLLDKYQYNIPSSSTNQSDSTQDYFSKKAQSAVGSSRPRPLRDQQEKPSINPNVGQASKVLWPSNTESKELKEQEKKQWSQPFASKDHKTGMSCQAKEMQETSDAILSAVSKVNELSNQQTKKRRPQVMVEESLDNLDFFKATNRGRMMNFNEEPKQEAKPQRRQWGQSPAKSNNSSGLQESNLSTGRQHHKSGAHVIVKNPFPDSAGNRNSSRKGQRSQQIEGDFLDKFLNQSKPIDNPLTKDDLAPIQKQPIIQPSQVVLQKNEVQKLALPTYEERLMTFSEPFFISNMPSGSKLVFNILSTWGDMNYVGLTGIEAFDIEGKSLHITSDQISAFPPDINILPGYGGDPRTIDKLVDGHYLTNDDLHVWLTPFTAGEDHTISIDLGAKKQIAMLRIWNYNKSRIHSYRGARLIECQLDSKIIFRGEIQKAPGNLNDPESCCEIILFTDNEAILSRIDQNDWINQKFVQVNDMEDTQRILQEVHLNEERPMTATKKFSTQEMQEIQRQLKQNKPMNLFDERPQTSAIIDQEENKSQSSLRARFDQKHSELSNQVKQISQQQIQQTSSSIKGKIIEFNILETWGDLFYVGLTGIEILDINNQPISLTLSMIDAKPRDMNSIPGHGQDYRTLDKLIDKVNNTADDKHMWLVPFNKGENHTITIDLGKVYYIGAIRFYNYNKSEEDSLRGAKQVAITVDKKLVTPKKGINIRKASGFVHPMQDLGQTVRIPFKKGWTTDQIVPLQRQLGDLGLFQEYDLVNLPTGFSFRFNLYSTHGDFYYIGLNGLEFYDQLGIPIKIQEIFAEPQGVNKLPGMESDVRVVQNLVNGQNQTYDEQNMWLAQFKNTRSYAAANKASDKEEDLSTRIPNYVYVVFDQPTAISAIRLWNYSKTPSRGVNEFEILVDDKQVYRGFARIAPDRTHAGFNHDFSTTVLFTTDTKIVDKFKQSVNFEINKQQSVNLYNEKKLMNKNEMGKKLQEEYVAFDEMQRPQTMARKR